MKHNTWALSAIRDLQELTNGCGLTSVSEALDEVYGVAIAELNDTTQCDEPIEDTLTPFTTNNVVKLHSATTRMSSQPRST